MSAGAYIWKGMHYVLKEQWSWPSSCWNIVPYPILLSLTSRLVRSQTKEWRLLPRDCWWRGIYESLTLGKALHLCTCMYAKKCVILFSRKIFGRELNLVVWWSVFATAKLKSAKVLYHFLLAYIRMAIPYRTAKFISPPILLQQRFWAQPPNLISTNISGYTVRLIFWQLTSRASYTLPLSYSLYWVLLGGWGSSWWD